MGQRTAPYCSAHILDPATRRSASSWNCPLGRPASGAAPAPTTVRRGPRQRVEVASAYPAMTRRSACPFPCKLHRFSRGTTAGLLHWVRGGALPPANSRPGGSPHTRRCERGRHRAMAARCGSRCLEFGRRRRLIIPIMHRPCEMHWEVTKETKGKGTAPSHGGTRPALKIWSPGEPRGDPRGPARPARSRRGAGQALPGAEH